MITENTLKEFIERRNAALLSLDKEAILAIAKESGVPPEGERIFWAGVHYARLGVASFPASVKEESLEWLRLNGFTVGDYEI